MNFLLNFFCGSTFHTQLVHFNVFWLDDEKVGGTNYCASFFKKIILMTFVINIKQFIIIRLVRFMMQSHVNTAMHDEYALNFFAKRCKQIKFSLKYKAIDLRFFFCVLFFHLISFDTNAFPSDSLWSIGLLIWYDSTLTFISLLQWKCDDSETFVLRRMTTISIKLGWLQLFHPFILFDDKLNYAAFFQL